MGAIFPLLLHCVKAQFADRWRRVLRLSTHPLNLIVVTMRRVVVMIIVIMYMYYLAIDHSLCSFDDIP